MFFNGLHPCQIIFNCYVTRLSTVNVYELVRFKISSVVHGGHNITPSAIFLVSRYALFFLLVFSCFDYYCNIFFLHFKFIQLIRSGDIEIQPGPIKNALKFCHWNLNSVLAHDRIKISLLEAYNSVYNYDILVSGETYLSGDINHDEAFIEGFSKNPFRKDGPSGLRKGGVCIYFKENLPIKRRVDLETLCAEGIVTEITLHRKKKHFLWAFIVHMAGHQTTSFYLCNV